MSPQPGGNDAEPLVARAEAHADRLTVTDGPSLDTVDRLVDRVIAGHRSVLATLDDELPESFRRDLESRSSGVRTTRHTAGTLGETTSDEGAAPGEAVAGVAFARDDQGRFLPRGTTGPNGEMPRDEKGRFLPRKQRLEAARKLEVREVTVTERTDATRFKQLTEDIVSPPRLRETSAFLEERSERERFVAQLVPHEFRPRTRQPVVTRGGVFYIAPRFEQAIGLGEVADARLIRAGYLTAEMFLEADDEALAELTGHAVETIRAGKADVDLTRLDGIDGQAADILRYLNVHSISRLAGRDPEYLAMEAARLRDQYRIWRFPEALSSAEAAARLIDQANSLVDA